jgi:hypothetical protein
LLLERCNVAIVFDDQNAPFTHRYTNAAA